MALRVASIALTEYNSDVYEPSDDSFALVDALEAAAPAWRAQRPRTCAEIGCGSGYVICSLAMLLRQLGICGSLFATDISQHALDATRRTLRAHAVGSVELIRTNLLDGLLDRLERRVDVLVFNPPYVPTPDEEVDRGGIAAAWAGGYKGRVVIDRVLQQLDRILAPGGELYMVTVLENEPEAIIQEMSQRGFSGSIVLKRAADEELLQIVRLVKQQQAPQ